MWTYRTPYTPEEQNKTYIEKRGRLELSRALNIGRVIGFVASGATAGYGQLDWTGLVNAAVQEAIRLAGGDDVRRSGALESTKATLMRFKAEGQIKRNATQVLGLAENLAYLAGKEKEFRAFIASRFSGSRDGQGDGGSSGFRADSKARLKECGFTRESQPLRSLISDLRVNRLLTLNYDVEIEKEFRRLFRSSGTSRGEKRKIHLAGDVAAEDGVSRPLESNFDMLCSGDPARAYDLPRRVEYTDGSSRSVLSVSMNGTNTADLVNFSLQPRQFMGQVVHLHGRYDKPEDIVLTDEDYRRTYLKSDRDAQTFEEALAALMTGNDILFVGVGMREADIMRPLRQFISQDRTPDFAKRHVFAMLEHSVTLDREWLKNTPRIDPADAAARTNHEALKADFAENHLEHFERHVPKAEGASRHDYTLDEQEALRLQSEFGVYALFHGKQWLRTVRLAVQLLQAALPVVRGQSEDGSEKDGDAKPYLINPFDKDVCPKAHKAACQAVSDRLQQMIDTGIGELNEGELQFLIDRLGGVQNRVARLRNPASIHKLNAQLVAISIEARSRALDEAINGLEEHRHKWWQDWRKRPKYRTTNFRRMYVPKDDNLRITTMARHHPVYSDIDVNAEQKNFEALDKICELSFRRWPP